MDFISRRPFVLLWWLVLSLYILAGVPITTFHGDETNHFYNSRDYATAFIAGRPGDLIIDFSQPVEGYYLRLSDSSVARYSMGLLWHLRGFAESDLPTRGWDWAQGYIANVEAELRPSPELLVTGRLASALFLCLSAGVMFLLGELIGGRWLGYIASAVYTLNPIILLNGRRALQEGSLLFFGLLAVYIAARISRRLGDKQRVASGWWAALVIAGGFTLASKNSGLIYIASAFVWIFIANMRIFSIRRVVVIGPKLAICGLVMIALLVALSPGLWGDPITGLGHVWKIRLEQIESQVKSVTPLATVGERVGAILTKPFIEPPAHFELVGWRKIPAIQREVVTYMASPLSGLQLGIVGGGLLMAMVVCGAIILLMRRESSIPHSLSVGVLAWVGVNIAVLLVNPLPWQRYFIPLIPPAALLAGIGIIHLTAAATRGRRADKVREAEAFENA